MMLHALGRLAGAASLQLTTNPARDAGRQWVGDSYRVDLTGGAPGAQVTVRRTGPSGQSQRIPGTTDANGNFTEAGNFTSANIGTWVDYWYIGSEFAGYYQVIVGPPPLGSALLNFPVPASTIPAPPPPPLPTPNPTSGTWQEQVLEGTTPAQIAAYAAAAAVPPPTGGPTPSTTTTPVYTTTVGPTGQLIPGVPNNYLLIGGGAILLLLAMKR